MLSDAGRRRAIAVMGLGGLLLVLGVFFVIASQPTVLQDFAFVGGQGQEFNLDATGMVSNAPRFLSPATGGMLLGAGVALATGVGGFVLGRRCR